MDIHDPDSDSDPDPDENALYTRLVYKDQGASPGNMDEKEIDKALFDLNK